MKRTIVHFFCMIMLVLMQFDVCGYDWIRWYHHTEQPSVEWTSGDETCVDDSETRLSEWSDPVYRHRPVRFNAWALLPAVLTGLYSLLPPAVSQRPMHRGPALQTANPHYLRFGVLRL